MENISSDKRFLNNDNIYETIFNIESKYGKSDFNPSPAAYQLKLQLISSDTLKNSI